jgi:hypothetical protein
MPGACQDLSVVLTKITLGTTVWVQHATHYSEVEFAEYIPRVGALSRVDLSYPTFLSRLLTYLAIAREASSKSSYLFSDSARKVDSVHYYYSAQTLQTPLLCSAHGSACCTPSYPPHRMLGHDGIMGMIRLRALPRLEAGNRAMRSECLEMSGLVVDCDREEQGSSGLSVLRRSSPCPCVTDASLRKPS